MLAFLGLTIIPTGRRVGKVLAFLGLTIGVVTAASDIPARAAAFSRDVTYLTAAQLAWAMLSDSLATRPEQIVSWGGGAWAEGGLHCRWLAL